MKAEIGVCGVATERWPRTSLYRARAGAWAARELHVRGARVSMSSAHVARSRVISGGSEVQALT